VLVNGEFSKWQLSLILHVKMRNDWVINQLIDLFKKMDLVPETGQIVLIKE
jgi:hypothetical protein